MARYTSVEDYLKDLGSEMKGWDDALMVDALDDAEEHLNSLIEELRSEERDMSEEAATSRAAQVFGSPRMFAKEYKRTYDVRKELIEKERQRIRERSVLYSMFGVFVEGRTYTGLLYLLLMMPLGIFYLIYIIAVGSLGLGLLVTVIGIPFLVLMLLSVYFFSWFHGRMTEAMLGEPMKKRRRKLRPTGSAWRRFKTITKDPRLYSSFLYLFLIFPLGIIYFTVFLTLLSVAFSFLSLPLLFIFLSAAGFGNLIPGPAWAGLMSSFLGPVTGFLLLTWTLHLSNITAFLHGKLSRALLVKK